MFWSLVALALGCPSGRGYFLSVSLSLRAKKAFVSWLANEDGGLTV